MKKQYKIFDIYMYSPDLLDYRGPRDLWSLTVGCKFNGSLTLALILRNFFEPLD